MKTLFVSKPTARRLACLGLVLGLALPLLAGCALLPASPAAVPTAVPLPLVDPDVKPAADKLTPPALTLTEQDAGRTVSLKPGETLLVTLEGNPSTGYTWEMLPAAGAVLTQLGEAEAQAQSNLVGASVQMRLTFQASTAGRQLLQLVYHRVWEKDVAPIKTFAVTVLVGQQAGQPAPEKTPAAPLPAVSLGQLDAGRVVYLALGQTLEITLEGNPSTGYSWEMEPVEGAVVSKVSESTLEPRSSLLGASTRLLLVFKAAAEGHQVLSLVYHRSWEKDVPPVNSFDVTVVVGQQAAALFPTPKPDVVPTRQATPPTVVFPAAGLKGWLTYTNLTYGFSFQYPADWKLEPGKGTMTGHAVLLTPPGAAPLTLQVAFKRTTEDAQIGRTGMGSGDCVNLGKVLMAGKEVERQVLVSDGKHMTVRYLCPGCMQRGDLEFGFDLDYRGSWSDPSALPADVEAQADLVVASLKLLK